MATTSEQSAKVTVPAAYIDDLRSALTAEIASGADSLRMAQAETLAADGKRREFRSEDRDSALRLLDTDVQLLKAVRYTDGDAELRADPGALWHVLEEMGRVLVDQLRGEFEYTPVTMQAVIELAVRLRWTADEAMRLPVT